MHDHDDDIVDDDQLVIRRRENALLGCQFALAALAGLERQPMYAGSYSAVQKARDILDSNQDLVAFCHIPKSVFYVLLAELREIVVILNHRSIPLEVALLVFLSFAARPAATRNIGFHWRISNSTVHQYIEIIGYAISELGSKYIQFSDGGTRDPALLSERVVARPQNRRSSSSKTLISRAEATAKLGLMGMASY